MTATVHNLTLERFRRAVALGEAAAVASIADARRDRARRRWLRNALADAAQEAADASRPLRHGQPCTISHPNGDMPATVYGFHAAGAPVVTVRLDHGGHILRVQVARVEGGDGPEAA